LPGVAIFLNPNGDTTPLALHAQVEHTHTLHKKVLLVSIDTVSIPHVDDHDRFAVDKLGPRTFNIRHLTIRNGYHDKLNIPSSLHECRKQGLLERDLDLEHASYFVSRITITPTPARPLRAWRKGLFIAMARNAASPIDHFGLPNDRTVMMGSQIAL
jgi:KUP system potassium uptake protein